MRATGLDKQYDITHVSRTPLLLVYLELSWWQANFRL
jgi:hypothetical protein